MPKSRDSQTISNAHLADLALCLRVYQIQQNKAVGIEYTTPFERELMSFVTERHRQFMKIQLEATAVKSYLDRDIAETRKMLTECKTPEKRRELYAEICALMDKIEKATNRLQQCQKLSMN